MRTKKNRGTRFLPLAPLVRAKREARKYKKLYQEELANTALAEARAVLANTDATMAYSMCEWLTTYVLKESNDEDKKRAYREFCQKQQRDYQELQKRLSKVSLSICGKTRNYVIS